MAITYVDNATAGFASAANLTTGAFGSAVQSGDLLIAVIYLQGLSSQASISFSDNLNSGSWTIASNTYANGIQTAVGFKVCNATGSAGTTEVTGGNFSTGGYLFALHYNGFAAVPTLISADTTGNSGSSTTYAATGFSNSQPNELLIGTIWLPSGGDTAGSPGGSWTDRASGGQVRTMDELLTSSGNSVTFTGSVSPSDSWIATLTGFYDSAGITDTPSAGSLLLAGQAPLQVNGTVLIPLVA